MNISEKIPVETRYSVLQWVVANSVEFRPSENKEMLVSFLSCFVLVEHATRCVLLPIPGGNLLTLTHTHRPDIPEGGPCTHKSQV